MNILTNTILLLLTIHLLKIKPALTQIDLDQIEELIVLGFFTNDNSEFRKNYNECENLKKKILTAEILIDQYFDVILEVENFFKSMNIVKLKLTISANDFSASQEIKNISKDEFFEFLEAKEKIFKGSLIDSRLELKLKIINQEICDAVDSIYDLISYAHEDSTPNRSNTN